MGKATRSGRQSTRGPRPHLCQHGEATPDRHACNATPRDQRPRDPRRLRPHRAPLNRSHTSPGRPPGVNCRHTAGLDDVWSARHAGTVLSDKDTPDMGSTMVEPDGKSVEKAQTAPDPDDPRKVESPKELDKPAWTYTAKKAFAEFTNDQCTDQAAGLTYYAVLALFPALLALISLVGLFGDGARTVNSMMDMVSRFAPRDALDQIRPVLEQMVNTKAAGFALVFGLLGALWSASGYVGAFGRAMNRIYEIDEGRPVWKLRPMQLGLTAVILLLVALVATALVLSGGVAESIGSAVGLGDTAVQVWDIAKIPVVLIIVALIIAMLYYFTPNVRQPKFRWISVGAGVALVTWILASAGFGFYVSNFGSYNKTYGALAGVIVFLLWLWLTNLSLLFGAEVDSELERSRQLQSGIEAEETLQLPPKDTKASDKKAAKREESIEDGRLLRLEALDAGVVPPEKDGGEPDDPAVSDDRGRHGSSRADAG